MFQERFRLDPFWMLVGCILVNRASWSQAEASHEELRRRWPTPFDLAAASPPDVEPVVAQVGFGRQRAARLVRFARDWCLHRPEDAGEVLRMHGCGRYAADSWAIFVEGRTDLTPSDHHLAAYLEKSV
jgi:methyl-CpG-binding domain protein 4